MRADISSSARVIELCYETNRAVVRFEGLPPEIGNQVAFLPVSAAEPLARVNDEGFLVECSDLPLAPGLLLYGAPQPHPAEPKLPESLEAIPHRSLYELSGCIADVNTMLIGRDELRSLKARDAEIERLRGDAERYAWIKADGGDQFRAIQVQWATYLWDREIDTAIDQATPVQEAAATPAIPRGDLSRVWQAADDVCEWLNYEVSEKSPGLLKSVETLNEEMLRAEIRASRAAIDQARATGGEKANG